MKRLILLINLLMVFVIFLYSGCKKKSSDPNNGIDSIITRVDYHACWSEYHNLIAFYHYQYPDWNDPDTTGIYVINPDGTGKRMIYSGHFVFGVDWSNDGQWILINTNYQLVKILFETGEADTLTAPGEYFYPSWSPDDNHITYAWRGGDYRGVYIMAPDGSGHRLVIPYGNNPDWPYPDSLIYLNHSSDFPSGSICMADTSGDFIRIYQQPQPNIKPSSLKPRLHIESGRLVFQAVEFGENYSVWVKDPGSSQPRELREKAMTPNFSPDGSKIIFTNISYGNGRLYVINWDGTDLRQLTFDVQ